MRSTEEMKRLVRREAAHRQARRRAVLSGGVGAIALVLITAAVVRAGTVGSAEVSTGTDGAPPAGPVTTDAPALGPAPAGTVVVVDETGDTVVVAQPDGSPSVTVLRPGAPRSSTTATAVTSDDGETPTTAAPSTTQRPPPGPDPTTTTTLSPEDGLPPTPPERACTPDDIVRAPLQVFVPSADGWTGGAIPAGHVVQFGYSTLARSDITPCRTPDSLQVLSIDDANGTEIFRHTYDGGPGRLITPGSWVMFRGSVSWDPSCATPAPAPFVVSCTPVGGGTFTVHLTDQGVEFPPRSLTVAAPP